MMKAFVTACAILFCVVILSACASKKDDVEYERDRVSTTPWSKPASWEGGGALSGLQN